MVFTRSQLASMQVINDNPYKLQKIKQNNNIIYRGFVISKKEYQSKVDLFYDMIDEQNKKNSVLQCFWLNTPTITIITDEIPIKSLQKMLTKIIEDEKMWEKFDKTIAECVTPFEQYLMSPDVKEKIREGQLTFTFKKNKVDLSPLKEFSYWIRLCQKLFCSIQFNLLKNCENAKTTLQKAIISMEIYRTSIICRRLITNKYIFHGLQFYTVLTRKLLEILNMGLEYALYAFGIFYPEMVVSDCYPFFKKRKYYNNHKLKIKDEDPHFGEAKKMFYQFY